MKAVFLTAVTALLGSVLANGHNPIRRHGHDAFHARRQWGYPQSVTPASSATCGCTTTVITYWGSPTLGPASASPTATNPTTSLTTTISSTTYTTVTVQATPSAPLPTPSVTTFSTPGVYTIPSTVVTVYTQTIVPVPASSAVSAGTYTVGGVTTVVDTSTTIVCPYATVSPNGQTAIATTTYVCPSPGTYTIAPITTTISTSTIMVYPTPATVSPGTYTRPEQTLTITETSYVYVCPFSTGLPTTSPAAAAPTTTSTSTTVAPTTTSTSTTVAPTTTSTSTTVAPTTTSTPTAAGPTATSAPAATTTNGYSTSASSSSQPLPTNASGTSQVGNGDHYGITYSPYTPSSGCLDQSTIEADIAEIAGKGFKTVRIYSEDCNGLEYVGAAARAHGILMIIGVFISSSGIAGAQNQVDQITKWAQWDLVSLIVIGNEAVFNGYCSADVLASFIISTTSTFKSAGYSGQITTTETLNIWQTYGHVLCNAVDKVGANIHPFFNSGVKAEDAGTFVKGQLDLLRGICPGKTDVINLETGWPHKGGANGDAVAGQSEQITAISAIVKEAGSDSVILTFDDELWKQPGPYGVEQYWGCASIF